LSLGHFAAFCSVFTSAGVVLIMRRIGREEDRGVMVSAVMLGLLAVSVPMLFAVGRVPLWQDIGLVALSGLIMGSAQFVNLEALRRAPAASVAPMQYTMLIWALVYGVTIFGDPIRTNVLVGAGIVIASSLYIMHRERVRARMRAGEPAADGPSAMRAQGAAVAAPEAPRL
jgi:drug/metabolite transporter (DMT)-like permease